MLKADASMLKKGSGACRVIQVKELKMVVKTTSFIVIAYEGYRYTIIIGLLDRNHG